MYVSLSRLRIAEERAPELVTVSRWRDRDAFKAYMKSESQRSDRAPDNQHAADRCAICR